MLRTPPIFVLFVPLALMACAGDPPPAPGTEGASCPNDNNCRFGLRCIDAICQPGPDMPDAGAEPGDAGADPVDAGLDPDSGVLPAPESDTLSSGDVNTTPEGEALNYTLTGGAFMVRGADGRTSVRVEVGGLKPDTSYGVHVHVQACRTGGGAHYKLDEAVVDAEEANELWPAVQTDPNGWGAGYVTVEHTARPEAQAVVLHEPGTNERIACIDLQGGATVRTTGTLNPFEGDPDPGISGTATLERSTSGTTVQVELTGTLTADETYGVHVHEQPCTQDKGGGHYKLDPTIADVDAANEIWPAATANTAGDSASGSASTPHIARAKARSVVVHNPVDNSKLLCADLRL